MPVLFCADGYPKDTAISIAAEAVVAHKQEKRYNDQSHQSVMGDQHDQHPYGYKKGDKSDYFFHS